MNAEQIAFAALGLPWDQVESQARTVAYKAEELLNAAEESRREWFDNAKALEAQLPKPATAKGDGINSPELVNERHAIAQAGIAEMLSSAAALEAAAQVIDTTSLDSVGYADTVAPVQTPLFNEKPYVDAAPASVADDSSSASSSDSGTSSND